MRIYIESLQIDAIVGLLEIERVREQRVIVDLQATYHYDGEIFVNYADVATLIEQEIKRARYKLLEEALLDLKEKIITKYPQITQLQLKITKPDIINNCSVALSESWLDLHHLNGL